MLNILFPQRASLKCHHIYISKGLRIQAVTFTWYLQGIYNDGVGQDLNE
jgi:hypothetical protein